MRILVIGDIVGKPGRRAVAALVPGLRRELALDVVIANGENAAAGRGLTVKHGEGDLFAAGVDVITSGNHIWDQQEIIPYLDDGGAASCVPRTTRRARPAAASCASAALTVINLMGRTFMYEIDDPFRAADRLLADASSRARPSLVDMHAEATSEKIAMGWYLDGRVSAVVGTHTHVPTADAAHAPEGHGVRLRRRHVRPARLDHRRRGRSRCIRKFLTGMPARFTVAEKSRIVQFNSVLVDIDDATGRARSIERVDREWEQRWRARATSTRTAPRPTGA